MATIEASITAALMGRVATLPTTLTIAYRETVGQVPAECVMVDHMPNDDQRLAVAGAGRMKRMGILRLTVMRRPGQYEAAYREEAGLLAAHFSRDLRLTSGTVTIAVVKSSLGRSRADGGHWLTPISIYYETYA